MPSLAELLVDLAALSDDALQAVGAHIGALLDERRPGVGGTESSSVTIAPKYRGARGWVEVKVIHGHRYRYRRWYEGRCKRSQYLGKA